MLLLWTSCPTKNPGCTPATRRIIGREKLGGISMDGDGNAERQLLALWEAKRGARLMPARSDFDVIADLRPFLGRVMLIEVIEGGDYRFRIFGTTIAALVGEEHQNKRIGELPVDDARALKVVFDQVVRSRAPREFHHSGFRSRRIEGHRALALPLSRNGEEVDMIMYLLTPTPQLRQSFSARAR